MAHVDMTHRLPRHNSGRTYLDIRPSTQGNVAVGDTVEVSGGWLWTVDAIGDPVAARGHTEVRIWLRDERHPSTHNA